MIKVKIYPIMDDRSSANAQQSREDVVYIKKMVAEYRIFGILLLRKELVSPASYGVKHYEGFFTKF